MLAFSAKKMGIVPNRQEKADNGLCSRPESVSRATPDSGHRLTQRPPMEAGSMRTPRTAF